MDFNATKTYILRKLRMELPRNLYYHGLHHTWDVYNAAKRLAIHEEIAESDTKILLTAALFHDTGFLTTYHANEPYAVELIENVLPGFGYTQDQIKIIGNIIMSTQISIEPETELEYIMCDADHDYFGRSDYHMIAESLARELAEYGTTMTDLEWVERQIEFLETKHRFYTETAIEWRLEWKKRNIRELKEKKALLNKG